MFGNLRSLIAFPKLSLAPWNHVRGEREEGERLFEESDYAGAELHLAQAIVDSEQRHEPPNRRISLRLELGEAQRRQVPCVPGEVAPLSKLSTRLIR